jgi:PAS domain S-box-containing protein
MEPSLSILLLILFPLFLCLIGAGVYLRRRSSAASSSCGSQPKLPFDSGEFSKSFFEHSPDAFLVLDDTLTIILVNESYCRMTGRSRDEVIGKRPPFPGWPPANWDVIKDRVNAILQGDLQPFETLMYRKTGDSFPALFSVSKIQSYGDRIYYAVIIKDISERSRVEAALRASEAKFRSQFRNLPIPMYTWQKQGEDLVLIDYNDAAEKITKGGVALYLGKKASEMYRELPDIIEDLRKCYSEQSSFQKNMIYHYKTQDRSAHLAVTYAFVPPEFVLVHTEDRTARVQAQEMLQTSEARLKTAVESLPFGFFMIDESGRYSMINSAIREQWGDQLIGKRPEDLTAEKETLDIWLDNNRRAFAGEIVREEVSYVVAGKNRIYYNIISPVRTHDRTRGILGVNIDITDLRETERALRESDARLRLMVEQLPALMWTIDKDLIFTSSIGAALEELSLTSNEVVGMSLYDYFRTDDPDFLPIAMHRKSLEGKATAFEIDWNSHTWETHTEPLRDANGAIIGCLAIALNITKRKQAEKLIHQSRMELRALAGRLNAVREEESTIIARRIHDELGQSLTGLRWDVSRLCKQMVESMRTDPVPEFEDKMKDIASGIDATIQRLREISAQLRPLILDDLGLLGAFEWQINKFRKNTGLTCEFRQVALDEKDLNLDSDRSTAAFRILQEILTNIRQHAEAKNVWIELRAEENLLYFSVRDDGKGMILHVSDQMNSLGILGMRERAQAFGGTVVIESAENEGTCVRVTIPAIDRDLNPITR